MKKSIEEFKRQREESRRAEDIVVILVITILCVGLLLMLFDALHLVVDDLYGASLTEKPDPIQVVQSYPSFDFGELIKVLDGDTVKAQLYYRGETSVRILGLDSYETRKIRRAYKQIQEGGTIEDVIKMGKEARGKLLKTLKDKPLLIIFSERRYGYYGRPIAQVLFPDCQTGRWIDVRQYMLKNFPNYYVEEGKR